MYVESKEIETPTPGTTGAELLETCAPELSAAAVAANLDNEIHDLQNPVDGCHNLTFVRLDSAEGWDVYRRSVIFLLITAVHELDPAAEVTVDFSANGGLFIEVRGVAGGLTAEGVATIEAKMRAIVAEDRPIVKSFLPRDEAVRIFKQAKAIEKANLIAALSQETVSIYRCGGYADYLYGAMLGHTGALGRFALDFFAPGLLLRTPSPETRGEVIFSEGVMKKRITKEKMCEVLSENPAKLYGLYPRKGVIAEGADADLVVIDPAREKKITRETQVSRSDYAPLEGMMIQGVIEDVYLRGVLAAQEGKVLEKSRGMFLRRKPFMPL